jgi:diaminohydroxyphosphoribosylaminopyrimidine deaminase/5-amino-6-(5-phosphoribosylamino)uracil reductase
VLLVAAQDTPARRGELERAGAQIALLPGAGGKVDLSAAMDELGRQGVNEVHVEAGLKLNGSLLQAGLVDELLVYLAPRLIGPGRDMANLPALSALEQTLDFEFVECVPVGNDVRLRARKRLDSQLRG